MRRLFNAVKIYFSVYSFDERVCSGNKEGFNELIILNS